MRFFKGYLYFFFLMITVTGLLLGNTAVRDGQLSSYGVFSSKSNHISISEVWLNDLGMMSQNDSVIIPLKRSGNLFLMDAIIDNESGNLVFDSGATGLVLNKTYFRNYVVIDNPASKGITGSVGTIDKVSVDRIKVYDLSFQHVTAQLAELGHIENHRGVKILGLFGFGLIKNFEIVFDPENQELRLYHIDNRGNRINQTTRAFKADYIQKINITNNVIFLKGTIGGKNLRFCFDTGAEANAVTSDAPKTVLNTITINRTSKLRGSGSSMVDVLYGTMNDFMFGNTQLATMVTIVTNIDNLKDAYGVSFDGVLGYDFISNGSFCINFVKNQLGICYLKAGKK